jgi:hypothetical protein
VEPGLCSARGGTTLGNPGGPDRVCGRTGRSGPHRREAAPRPHKSRGARVRPVWQLDLLINDAGVAPISLLDDLQVEDWEETSILRAPSMESRRRCLFSVDKALDTSSTRSPPPASGSFRRRQCTPVRRTPCERYPKVCGRKQATSCASLLFRRASSAQNSRPR